MAERLKPQMCVIDREGDVTKDLGDTVATRDMLAPGLAPHTRGMVLTVADCEDPPIAWCEDAMGLMGAWTPEDFAELAALYDCTSAYVVHDIVRAFLAAARAEAEAR